MRFLCFVIVETFVCAILGRLHNTCSLLGDSHYKGHKQLSCPFLYVGNSPLNDHLHILRNGPYDCKTCVCGCIFDIVDIVVYLFFAEEIRIRHISYRGFLCHIFVYCWHLVQGQQKNIGRQIFDPIFSIGRIYRTLWSRPLSFALISSTSADGWMFFNSECPVLLKLV